MNQQNFLVEVGTEELPPKALKRLSDAFSQSITAQLHTKGLQFGPCTAFAAPRRLALKIEALPAQTPFSELELWGPPAHIAFDKEGNVTKAGLAFAQKNGVAVEALQVKSDGKIDKLYVQVVQGGQDVTELLGAIVTQALADLPIPKRMRWGAKKDEFVRPVHWLVMLYGSSVVETHIMGLSAGRATRGHRFHHNQSIELAHADDYAARLKSPGFVLAHFEERKTLIQKQVIAAAEALNGIAQIDPDLLDEVTGLVEWPVALAGAFEQRFLAVPSEALISSMGEHQKYFHVFDADGKLMPHFITVANLVSKDPQQVIDGNERVIRPRLSDAAFFFETDKKVSLISQRERLKSIVFQAKLGSIFDKTTRVAALAGLIAEQIGANAHYASRAGELSKADLVSAMVGEFDKMQGIAGYYYALNDGEPAEVAHAIVEHYLPKFSGDVLPSSREGIAVALADRLDTIVGIFAAGEKPTGSKDPFAIRRMCIAVLRLLVEKSLGLDLKELLRLAIFNYAADVLHDNREELIESCFSYIIDRFGASYKDNGIAIEIFMSVIAKELSVPFDIDNRVMAVQKFSELPEALALAAANKRVANILAKLESEPSTTIDLALLSEPAEQLLAEQIAEQMVLTEPLFGQSRYTEALLSLARLQPTVDSFFDQVMVMADDPAVRNNRLALLMRLRNLFLEVADISLLVPAKA